MYYLYLACATVVWFSQVSHYSNDIFSLCVMLWSHEICTICVVKIMIFYWDSIKPSEFSLQSHYTSFFFFEFMVNFTMLSKLHHIGLFKCVLLLEWTICWSCWLSEITTIFNRFLEKHLYLMTSWTTQPGSYACRMNSTHMCK
jgi:hypothetical protein